MITLDHLIELIEDYKKEKCLPPHLDAEDLAETLYDVIEEQQEEECQDCKAKTSFPEEIEENG